MAIAYGLVAISAVEALLNIGFSLRYTQLTAWHIATTLTPVVALSVAMYFGVTMLGTLLHSTGIAIRLAVEILAGATLYLAAAALLRLEALSDMVSILRRMIVRRSA